MLAGGIVNKAISSDELESEEMRRVTVESSPHFLSSPELHRVNNTEFGLL